MGTRHYLHLAKVKSRSDFPGEQNLSGGLPGRQSQLGMGRLNREGGQPLERVMEKSMWELVREERNENRGWRETGRGRT